MRAERVCLRRLFRCCLVCLGCCPVWLLFCLAAVSLGGLLGAVVVGGAPGGVCLVLFCPGPALPWAGAANGQDWKGWKYQKGNKRLCFWCFLCLLVACLEVGASQFITALTWGFGFGAGFRAVLPWPGLLGGRWPPARRCWAGYWRCVACCGRALLSWAVLV